MSNKGVANTAPLVIQQPPIVSQQPMQPPSDPGEEGKPGISKESQTSTQGEVSENHLIELNNRDQSGSQPPDQNESMPAKDPLGTEADLNTLLTSPPTSPSNISPEINPPVATTEITSPSLGKPLTNSADTLPVVEDTSTEHTHQSTIALDSVSDSTAPNPKSETKEVRRILVRTVENNEQKLGATKEQSAQKKESLEVRPKIKVQAKQPCMPKIRIESNQLPPKITFEPNQYQAKIKIDCHNDFIDVQNEIKQAVPKIPNRTLPKLKVEVRKPTVVVQARTTPTINRAVVRTDSTENEIQERDSRETGVSTCKQEVESTGDVRGRREEARLKRRAERQAKLRAETMSGTSSNSNLPPTPEASPSLQTRPDYTLPFRGSYGFSTLDFSSPEITHTPNRSQERVSPTTRSSESHRTRITHSTPSDQTRDRTKSPQTPKSDPSLSGFMKPEAIGLGMKPGSFMLYPKGIPTAVSPDEPELSADPYSGPVDLSDSPEFEQMEDTAPESIEESDRMDEEKSSCRDTTPSLSSRTATVSPSRSSSFSMSRGSRSRSWTKSSSQSNQSKSRSPSRSRSHNSSTSSTTPTRSRKHRRRRRRTPSTPSMRSRSPSPSQSLTPTPTPTPTRSRHSSKRKKEKFSSSESPVPRKYRNSSTDEFDPDYAAFTEVPPGNRDTDAFAYFGNQSADERERTPHSYTTPRVSVDRYHPPRPYTPRFPRSGYSHNHAYGSRGHDVHIHDHHDTSPRHRGSYRGGYTNYSHTNRERSNYSGNYISSRSSPQKSSYPHIPHRGSYNNHPSSYRGSYNSSTYQKPSYTSHTQPRAHYGYPQRGGYTNYQHQRESYHTTKRHSDTGSSEKKDNSGFGAFYRKDEAEWEDEGHNRRIQRNSSPSSSNRSVPARLAGRLGPLPSGQYHKNESILWKGGSRGRPYQDRSGYKKWRTGSYNSDEEYKLNLKIKDIIAKNEEILRRKIEIEEDKMIHGIS